MVRGKNISPPLILYGANGIPMIFGIIFLTLILVVFTACLAFALLKNEFKDSQDLRDAYDSARDIELKEIASGNSDRAIGAQNVSDAYKFYLSELRRYPRWRESLIVALVTTFFVFLASFCSPRTYAVVLVCILASFLFTQALLGWIAYHNVYVF